MHDITNNIVQAIQEYVNEEFSSSPWKYDLMQDVKTIKRVFGKDSKMMSSLAKKIGKISSQCFLNPTNYCINDTALFNSKEEPCSFGYLHEAIGEIFSNHRELIFASELECMIENLRIIQTPIRNYIKAAHYETSLEAIRSLKDNYSNDKDNADTNSTVDVSQNNPLFIENPFLKKYNNFEALRSLFRLQDIDYGRTFIRIDVKQSETLISEAKEELIEKCFQLNEHQYDEIKIQFGIIITGVQATLLLISFDPNTKKEFDLGSYFSYYCAERTICDVLFHLNRYDLRCQRQRESFVFSLMVLTEMSKQLSRKYPAPDEFLKFKHPDTIQRIRTNPFGFDQPYWIKDPPYAEIKFNYMLNMVEKKVYDENRITSRELLNQFNKLIAYGQESQIGSIRSITDTVRVTKYNPSSKVYNVWIEPIGYTYEAMISRVTRSIREFKKAIMCVMEAALSMHANGFVHRDIAWRNITYDRGKDTYLLFDFELIGKLCNRSCRNEKHRGFHCSPAILDAAYILKLFAHFSFYQYDEYSNFASQFNPNELVRNVYEEEDKDDNEDEENEEEIQDEKDEPSPKIRKLNNEDEENDENKENNPVLVNEENEKDVKDEDSIEFEIDDEDANEEDEKNKKDVEKRRKVKEAKIKKQNKEKIKKIKELFWKFYFENINEFKPNLSPEDIQKRKMDSTF